MDLRILEIASNTENNKVIDDFTHQSKNKNPICGDEMEISLVVKNDTVIDMGYQCKSCVYCHASTNLVTKTLIKQTKNKLNYLLDNLVDYFEDEIKPLPKDLIKFKKLFNKKNISRKNCVIMPLIAPKKMSIDE